MVASDATVRAVVDVLLRHLGMIEACILVAELTQVSGNASFTQTLHKVQADLNNLRANGVL